LTPLFFGWTISLKKYKEIDKKQRTDFVILVGKHGAGTYRTFGGF
jgi:hypothetical protein